MNIKIVVLLTVLSLPIFNGCSCPKPMDTQKTPIKTKSGLQYIIQKEGTGTIEATSGKIVTVHYTGWLADEKGNPGKKFDSSLDRNKPFMFILDGGMVIKGWDEGVKGMKVTEKRRLIIPSSLGYGPQGIAGTIPGGATLIFDVELIAIK